MACIGQRRADWGVSNSLGLVPSSTLVGIAYLTRVQLICQEVISDVMEGWVSHNVKSERVGFTQQSCNRCRGSRATWSIPYQLLLRTV